MKTTSIKATPMPYAKRWAALAVLCAAQFMVIMDTSIIGVALPAIQKDLGYTASSLQWIFNAYVILLGGLLLLGGKLSDIYGPRKIFMVGFGILTAASLLAGLAWSAPVLNTARALQGAGSALIAPAALTLLMGMFTDPKEMAKAFGFWGAAAAAGGSAGVFLGGLLTEWASWQCPFAAVIRLKTKRQGRFTGSFNSHSSPNYVGICYCNRRTSRLGISTNLGTNCNCTNAYYCICPTAKTQRPTFSAPINIQSCQPFSRQYCNGINGRRLDSVVVLPQSVPATNSKTICF